MGVAGEWVWLILEMLSLTIAGRPVFIWRLGETDVKGLLKAGGESALLKYVRVVIVTLKAVLSVVHAATRC